MAVQAGSVCYETPEAAAASIAAGNQGHLVQVGAGLYSVDVVGVQASGIEYLLTNMEDGGPSLPSIVVPYTPQPCNLLQVGDGIELGWLVILAWATTWGVRFLTRQFRER